MSNIPVDEAERLKNACNNYWAAHHSEYDFAHKEECGEYIIHLVEDLSPSFPRVGLLRKNPSQTNYKGVGIDVIAYDLGGNVTHAVDLIFAAEQPHPWKSEEPNNPNAKEDPRPVFNEDTANDYKTNSDWLSEPVEEPGVKMVPWVGYNEQGFQELKRQLAYDYARRPQGADFDVSVWAGRYFHNSYMGPEGTPLGETAGLERARKEWCAALQVPVVPVPPNWKIGDPV